jgi:hypothetical protein
VGWNLSASQVRTLESDAVVGRRRFEKDFDPLAGMQAYSGAMNGSPKGSLSRHTSMAVSLEAIGLPSDGQSGVLLLTLS